MTGSRPENGSSRSRRRGDVHQGCGQLNFLRHALGEPGDGTPRPLAEVQALDQPRRGATGLRRGQALEAPKVGDHAKHAHLAVETPLLRQETDQRRLVAAGRAAQHLDAARGGAENVEGHPKGRGLAGAVGAKEAEDATLGDSEAEMIDRGERAEPLDHGLEGQDGHALALAKGSGVIPFPPKAAA